MENINSILNNINNVYYGHGIGKNDEHIISSILNDGLRCSHGSVYFTTMSLGVGGKISQDSEGLLRNWPHKESEIVIILSLPMKYKIMHTMGYMLEDAAYYYTPSETDKKRNPQLTYSQYVMPEFIKGYYDAKADTFVPNPKYYENLSFEDQKNLFSKVKANYFDIIDKKYGIDNYKSLISSLPDSGWQFGLTNEEVSDFKQKKGKINSKRKFVEGFINAYDVIEDELQSEIRKQHEKNDIERIKYIVETGFAGPLVDDIKGEWIINQNKNHVEQYSQKQVLAMARLLKTAKRLTEDESLNPEKKDYLGEFIKVSDVNHALKQMHSDMKIDGTYMHKFREQARKTIKKDEKPQEEIIEVFDVDLPLTKDNERAELDKARQAYEELSQSTPTKSTQKELEEAIKIYEEGTTEVKQVPSPIQANVLKPGITKAQAEEQKRKQEQERYRKEHEEKHRREEEQHKKIEEQKKQREQQQERQQQLEELRQVKEAISIYEDETYNPTWYTNNNENKNSQRHGMKH